MVKQYQFGHTAVEVSFEQEISFPLNWKQFECESKSIQRKYELKFTDNLIRIENEFRSMYPVINGDRSLLLHNSDGWYAYGWPICGSSEICYNENYPIKAIVMLYQAKENVVKRLGMADAMKKVIPQITINMWDTEFQLCAIDLITQLISEVPVYELGCDISESAVVCLESVLNERG